MYPQKFKAHFPYIFLQKSPLMLSIEFKDFWTIFASKIHFVFRVQFPIQLELLPKQQTHVRPMTDRVEPRTAKYLRHVSF